MKAERLLKQENVKKKVPDGIVPFGATYLVIEVERTLKKKEYYRKMFLDTCIRQFKDEEIILYITADESDKRWLIQQAKGWVRIYFATISDLREMADNVIFKNVDGKEFKILRKQEFNSSDTVWRIRRRCLRN